MLASCEEAAYILSKFYFCIWARHLKLHFLETLNTIIHANPRKSRSYRVVVQKLTIIAWPGLAFSLLKISCSHKNITVAMCRLRYGFDELSLYILHRCLATFNSTRTLEGLLIGRQPLFVHGIYHVWIFFSSTSNSKSDLTLWIASCTCLSNSSFLFHLWCMYELESSTRPSFQGTKPSSCV